MKKLMVASVVWMLMGGSMLSARVIGKVNGYPITERAANDFLKVVTKGKLKYHQLRPKDKKDVIKRIAVDSLLIGMANRHVSRTERNQVIVNYWLAKKIGHVTVSDKAVRDAYRSNKKFFKDKQGKILPLQKVKDAIAVSLKQKKYVAKLMEGAKITMGKKVIQSGRKGRKRSATSANGGKSKSYTVKSGNTLSGIAHKYHITINQLRIMNGMKESDTLKVGQKLKVPVQ